MDDEGGEGKREGMDRAWRHASPEWKRAALTSVREVAQRKPSFTTDDVWAWLHRFHPGVTTHERRALGPIMREAAKLGYCVKTTDTDESTRGINHRRPVRVWWSNIYKGPPVRRPPRRKTIDPRQFDLFG